MSLLFFDGFDHYATAQMAAKWNIDGGSIVAFGRNGGNCARGPLGAYRSVPASGTTYIVGAAIKPRSAVAGQRIFEVMQGATDSDLQCYLRINADLTLSFLDGAGVAWTSSWNATLDNWYYIELKVVLDNSVGTAEVRVDGTAVINKTSIDTQGRATATWAGLRITQGNCDVDDLYLCDGSGSINNDFLGDCRVEALLPQTDAVTAGFNAGLTPSTGSDHGALVDEVTPNGDTDYNKGATAGLKDTYNFPNMASTGDIKGVQVLLYVRKTDQVTKTLRPVVRHAGTDYPGTTVTAAIGFEYKRQLYETNPGTSAVFTGSDVNSLQAGGEVVS